MGNHPDATRVTMLGDGNFRLDTCNDKESLALLNNNANTATPAKLREALQTCDNDTYGFNETGNFLKNECYSEARWTNKPFPSYKRNTDHHKGMFNMKVTPSLT